MKHTRFYGRVLWGAILLLFALTIFALPRITHLQAIYDVPVNSTNKGGMAPTGKHVNFDEPRQLDLGADAATSPPVALVKADFDSDGFADVVTADSTGGLNLLKGIDPTNFAIDPKTGEPARPEPFSAAATGASLGISPDFLFAGDLNADGRSDILGAAKGANALVVVIGDGHGHFSRAVNIGVGGSITAIESGEIGKPDGQADLAVTFSNKNGNFLAVYEHPESAFKHPPEIIKLPSAATAIAVGNMDEDFYSDIAIACGADLVVVHERGQAYPWDIVKGSGISRPPAVVETRHLSFSIAAMTTGRFGEKRGTSLAVLGKDGNLYHLEAPKNAVSPGVKLNPALVSALKAGPFMPADGNGKAMATITQTPLSTGDIDAYGNTVADRTNRKNPAEMLAESASKEQPQNIDPDEITRRNAEDAPRKAMMQERVRSAFVRGISARTTNLANWEIGQITTDNRFAAIAGNETRLTPVGVSDSPFHDIVVTSSRTGRVDIVSRFRDGTGRSKIENTMLDGSGGVLAVMPMGLNIDGLSDLVVLRQGTSTPTVLMSAPSAVFVVNTTADDADCNFGGSCSLRDAIRRANLIEGSSTIYFNIAETPSVITPLTPLPAILRPVTIQGSHMSNGTKLVEINGDNAGTAVDGLKIRTSNAFIFDLAITGFQSQTIGGSEVGGNGIAVESDSAHPNNANNTILECYLGIDPTGTTAKKNFAAGVLIFDSDNNGVSGSTISGNGTGIAVEGGNTNNIANNIIGLNTAGTQKVPNFQGVFLGGANNTVGGDYAGAPNTISGNGGGGTPCFGSGIVVPIFADITTNELLSHGNSIVGNKIGTDPGGAVGLGNCSQGIDVHPLTGTTIGSIAVSGRNIISDNGLGGIYCEALEAVFGFPVTEGGFCSIMGNNIGTDVTGTISIYNDKRNTPPISSAHGVVTVGSNYSLSAIGAPGGTSINGACTGFCNLISGNTGGFDLEANVMIAGPGIVGVFNNYIGPNNSGSQSLGNPAIGVLSASTIVPGASPSYFVGGHTELEGSLGNLIVGSGFNGVCIECFNVQSVPGNYHLSGNLIGLDSTGNTAIPNGGGIQVSSLAFGTTIEIGDEDPLGRNVIAGNTGDGIGIYAGFGVMIFQNAIGVNSDLAPLGNGGHGINVGGLYALSTIIGGTDSTTSNIIANNAKTGVKINSNARYNKIRGNTIFNNGNLGIDLSNTNYFDSDGVTPNDYCSLDSDGGANLLQNFPELFAPTANPDGTISVEGFLRSSPHGTFEIDFYANAPADPSGHGEGQSFVGSRTVITDGNGFGSFVFVSTIPVPAASAISATATDTLGNTSEFSCIAGESCNELNGAANLREYLLAPEEACPASITVNLAGDEPDANLADGFCDIDVSNGDNHECTLRAALQIVMQDGYVGTHTIGFNIPGPGVQMITTTGLPAITKYVILDGESQPGYVDKPLIEIRGSGPTAGTGFEVRTTGATIKGFALNNFFDHAIYIDGGSDNRIQACFIGVAADGTTPGPDLPNSTAIMIENSRSNTIGGSAPLAKNVIAHSFYGIYITGGQNNNVLNNRIGTDASGFEPRGNAYGLVLIGTNGNQIGSKLDVDGNTISANGIGVKIGGNSENNTLAGNLIGTSVNGFFPLGNLANGIQIDSGAKNNNIGRSIAASGGNIISGQNSSSSSAGILIDPDAGIRNRISGNNIGLNKEATNKIANRVGIVVLADEQIIGGGSGDIRNAISGNEGAGIFVLPLEGSSNPEVNKTKITYNYIGTGRHNETDLGNGTFGIVLQDKVAATNIIGNIIGGNHFGGIFLVQTAASAFGPSGNNILENKVGVNENADMKLPNPIGIFLKGATSNLIGRNTLSGNSFAGMLMGATGDLSSAQDLDVSGLSNPVLADLVSGKRVPALGSLAPLTTALTIDNKVYDNRIGVDNAGGSPSGQSPIRNGVIGLFVGEGANNNCIGGCDPTKSEGGPGNTISGHIEATPNDSSVGLFLGSLGQTPDDAVKPRGNRIRDNLIGLDRSMQSCIPNWIGLAVSNAGDNQIGEFTQHGPSGGRVRHGNVVACNAKNAIEIRNNEIGELKVGANWVGTTPNFGIPLEPGNGFGGIVILAERQRITRRIYVYENIVGNHTGSGIRVRTPGNAPRAVPRGQGAAPLIEISGNLIGVEPDGNGGYSPIQNGVGVELDCVSGAYVGDFAGSGAMKNIVAGNLGDGISVMGPNASTVPCSESGSNVIADSIVGTDPDGRTTLGNGGNGIALRGTQNNTIGLENRGNTIGGNFENGVLVEGGGLNNFLNNNIGIAQDALGSKKVSNHLAGMNLLQTTSNQIFLLNKIAGNTGAGIRLQNAAQTSIRNNRVGTDENNSPNLGNGASGIVISDDSRLNIVGGPETGSGNVIANNVGAGVWLDSSAGHCNMIDPNSIYGNTGLGIDLGSPGHSPNDAGDADAGPNNLQNYPQINLWQVDVYGDLLINYSVDSLAANSNYGASGIYVEFFEADMSGEGERFIGSNYWTLADLANGGKVINLGNAAALGISQGDLITASASDADGNTSEFFPPFSPTAAGVAISGRVTTAQGQGIGRAVLTLTDANGQSRRVLTNGFGNFKFDDVETGRTYVLTVAHKEYVFADSARLISLVDELTDVNFTSLP